MDQARLAQAFKRPGSDPRQWISYGTVDKDAPNAPSVRFKDDDGNPLPYGPMVNVTLQPLGIALPCRVSSFVAGQAEGEWYPFVSGDEVLVAIPEGDERAGAVIIGRLNQELDVWPTVVAGQDSTKNTFGFRRMRTPYIVETAASYLIRSALTGSQIGIDAQGQVIINDGDKGSLVIGAEAIGMSSGDGETFATVFPPSKEVFLGAGASSFLLSASETKFISEGAISFATVGGASNQTAVTAEQVLAILINLVAQLATMGVFKDGSPLATATYNAAPPGSCITAIAGIFTPILAALATPTPFAGPPGGSMAPFIGTLLGPAGALVGAMSNPIAPVDPSGSVFGFGRPGFKL